MAPKNWRQKFLKSKKKEGFWLEIFSSQTEVSTVHFLHSHGSAFFTRPSCPLLEPPQCEVPGSQRKLEEKKRGDFFFWNTRKGSERSVEILELLVANELRYRNKRIYIWVFPKIGVPQNGWFIMENPIKTDDLGYHHLRKHRSIASKSLFLGPHLKNLPLLQGNSYQKSWKQLLPSFQTSQVFRSKTVPKLFQRNKRKKTVPNMQHHSWDLRNP